MSVEREFTREIPGGSVRLQVLGYIAPRTEEFCPTYGPIFVEIVEIDDPETLTESLKGRLEPDHEVPTQ